jgi:hypothetical protein
MSEETLPEGWAMGCLSDLFSHRSGNSKIIKGKQASTPGNGLFPAYSASGQDVWVTDAEQFGPGLVISAVGARCGRVFRARHEAWTAIANTHVMRPVSNEVISDFWWHLVNDQDWWVRSGSAQPFVVVKKSLERPVPIPPFKEQRRIVDELERRLSHVDAAEASLTASRRRIKVAVRAVICDSLKEPWSSEWREVTVDGAGDARLGLQRSPSRHQGTNMKPYLRVANVFEDRIDLDDVMSMHFTSDEESRCRLVSGDILLNEGQSPEFLGRPAMWRDESEEMYFTNSLIRFRCGENVLPEWALLVFRRHMHTGRFRKESRITTNIAHLALGRFKGVEFPIPPLDEQHAIVSEAERRISLLEAALKSTDSQIQRCQVLRRSILATAFAGKLVPQDPNDEPAADLLARIRTDREVAASVIPKPKTTTRKAKTKKESVA